MMTFGIIIIQLDQSVSFGPSMAEKGNELFCLQSLPISFLATINLVIEKDLLTGKAPILV